MFRTDSPVRGKPDIKKLLKKTLKKFLLTATTRLHHINCIHIMNSPKFWRQQISFKYDIYLTESLDKLMDGFSAEYYVPNETG